MTYSLVPNRRAWPVFLGLAAIFGGGFLGAEEEGDQNGTVSKQAASSGEERGGARHPLTRYESLWQRSLFHAPVQAVVADPAFAREYTLAGVFEMDGRATVALVRKRDGVVINVGDDDQVGENSDGFKLVAVEPGVGTQGARVKVAKGGVQAWIAATPVAASASNVPAAEMAPPVERRQADSSEFSDWEDFSEMRSEVPLREMPRQGEQAPLPSVLRPSEAPQGTPAVPVPPAPNVKQPVPVPPSPLDAAMTAVENEIVVPIEK